MQRFGVQDAQLLPRRPPLARPADLPLLAAEVHAVVDDVLNGWRAGGLGYGLGYGVSGVSGGANSGGVHSGGVSGGVNSGVNSGISSGVSCGVSYGGLKALFELVNGGVALGRGRSDLNSGAGATAVALWRRSDAL